jgi:hypothetical protein
MTKKILGNECRKVEGQGLVGPSVVSRWAELEEQSSFGLNPVCVDWSL